MKKNSIKSIIILVVSACIWGFAFVAQVESNLGVLWFNGIRFLMGALAVVPVFLILEKEKMNRMRIKHLFKWGAIGGTVLFFATTFQQWGISISKNAGKSGFITGFYMVLVPIAVSIITRTKLRRNAFIGAIVALVGLFFVSFSNGFSMPEIGDILTFIGAFMWTAHILVLDRVPMGVPPIRFSSVQFLVTGLISVFLAPIIESNVVISGTTIMENLIPILYCGIMSSGVAFTGQAVGQRGCDAGLASIFLSLESVFSVIGGVILLHENLGFRGYIGCALIFAGIIIVQLDSKKKNEEIKKGKEGENNA